MTKTSYQSNLKYDEIKICVLFDMVLKQSNKGYFFNPYEFGSTTFMPLLDKIDNSETKNIFSFVPIGFLRQKYNLNLKFDSEFDEKKALLELAKKDNILEEEYLGIKLKYLKKPIIPFRINTECKNFENNENLDDLENDLQLKHQSHVDPNNIIYYLHTDSIDEISKRLCYLSDDIYFGNTILLIPESNSFRILNSSNLKNIFKKNYNVFIFPVLFSNHFTIVGIDRNRKYMFFYNSGGHDSKSLYLNSNYSHYFVSPSFKCKKKTANNVATYFKNNGKLIRYPNFLIEEFSKYNSFKRIIYNTFSQQLSTTECGPFCIAFMFGYLNTNITKFTDIKHVYNSVVSKGDLMASYIKSCVFTCESDLTEEEIKNYEHTLSVWKNKNLHFKDYLKKFDEYFTEFYDTFLKSKHKKHEFLFNHILNNQ